MIKSILVALDDSPSSKAALDVASEIARLCGSKLKGLYVEDVLRLLEWQPAELISAVITTSPNIPHGRPTTEQVEIEKEFLAEGNRLKDLFKDTLDKFSLEGEFEVLRGKVDDLIIEYAKTVDLVVIGRRGKTYPETSKEPGPTTENLLRHSTRPVIVVPPEGKLNNHMLIAYDGSKSSQRALAAGAMLAAFLNSDVRVVSVGDDIDKAEIPLKEAEKFISSYKIPAKFIVAFGSRKPWEAIMDHVKNHSTGLIVLGAFGDQRLLELIFGSTTREVLMRATCPVLLAK